MRISDWSSDVCSSDLAAVFPFSGGGGAGGAPRDGRHRRQRGGAERLCPRANRRGIERSRGSAVGVAGCVDRKSVVSGKSVSVRVDLGVRRIIKTKRTTLIS